MSSNHVASTTEIVLHSALDMFCVLYNVILCYKLEQAASHPVLKRNFFRRIQNNVELQRITVSKVWIEGQSSSTGREEKIGPTQPCCSD